VRKWILYGLGIFFVLVGLAIGILWIWIQDYQTTKAQGNGQVIPVDRHQSVRSVTRHQELTTQDTLWIIRTHHGSGRNGAGPDDRVIAPETYPLVGRNDLRLYDSRKKQTNYHQQSSHEPLPPSDSRYASATDVHNYMLHP